MKHVFLILILFIFINSVSALTQIKVLKIYDGDTIQAQTDGGNKFSIRLIGIDCFETSKINRAYKQAYINKLNIDNVIKKRNKAKIYLEELYKNNSKTSFDFVGVDKYGRVLGVLWFDNFNVNEELLNKGYCSRFEYKADN